MSRKTSLVILFIASYCTIFSQNVVNDLFISPLKMVPALSATFAELRNDHFHSGLDYKTGGVTGKEVYSVADGYIYRISVSPTGFGRALYIKHPSGYSTVYGHLECFRQDIDEFVKKRQYELKNFSVTLYPTRDQFPVKKGDLVALSGNSGGSAGPHLHFEVRESGNENPLNPLLLNFEISDKVKPVIEKISLYPLTRNSSVNMSHERVTFRAAGSSGNYTISTQSHIVVNGLIGVGVKCWDSFDNSQNKCGVYSIEVIVDSTSIYTFTADKFSFSESRYLNSHIDYNARAENNEYMHKAFLEPGNRLSMYKGVVNRGMIRFTDNDDHRIQVRVTDIAGNLSVASFKVRSLDQAPLPAYEIKCSKILPYRKASDFTADGIRVHFPSTSFYDTLFLDYEIRKSNGKYLSPVHSVHRETFAVHDLFRLSIRPDTVIAGKENKMCLVNIDSKGNRSYSGGEYRYGFITAEVRKLGDYAVSMDTVSPEIIPSFSKGASLAGSKAATFTIRDEFSGIRSYDGIIDGAWALIEYDPKKNLLIYRPDPSVIKTGRIHKMQIKVTDNRNNQTTLLTEFMF